MGVLLVVDHPRVRRIHSAVFTTPFVGDCMTHACRCEDEGGRPLADACCQHGADVDLGERDLILGRAREIAGVLDPAWRDPASWFDDSDPEPWPDAPSGVVIRTGRAGPGEADGCVFLQHDARGCALHRAALAHGFAPASIKPLVCRLYPLALGDGTLALAEDFWRYSCAGVAGEPSVYRVLRPTLAEAFGDDLARALDALETEVRGRRLPVIA